VGTDDGNLQLTRDGAKSWTNVVGNVPNLPKFSWVSWVETGFYDNATAYAAFDRHTFGDMDPHVYKTTDYGKTWASVVAADGGVRGYAHVIKEDPVSRNILYLGTEFGLWISLDNGKHWAQYTGPNPPDAAVITYYQKKRHILGKMKLEIFDEQGKLVDTLPPNSRRGISRVEWPMRIRAPRVPPAATAAFEAAQGPRILPGTYTVKMTRGTE